MFNPWGGGDIVLMHPNSHLLIYPALQAKSLQHCPCYFKGLFSELRGELSEHRQTSNAVRHPRAQELSRRGYNTALHSLLMHAWATWTLKATL
jgi:hypothetical protein